MASTKWNKSVRLISILQDLYFHKICFLRYEVMLWAMTVEAKHAPTDCLSDFVLPHSVTKLETCESPNQTSRKVNCITKNDVSSKL